jgi:hypothetical protein
VSRFTSSAISRLSGKEPGIFENRLGAPQNNLSKNQLVAGKFPWCGTGNFYGRTGKIIGGTGKQPRIDFIASWTNHMFMLCSLYLVGRLPPGKWPGISRPVSTIIPAASSHTAAAVNGTRSRP